MLPIMYVYTFEYNVYVANLNYIPLLSILGAFIVMSQMFVSAFAKDPSPEELQKQKESGKPARPY